MFSCEVEDVIVSNKLRTRPIGPVYKQLHQLLGNIRPTIPSDYQQFRVVNSDTFS